MSNFRGSNVGRRALRPSPGTPARSRALVPAALGSGLLWLSTVVGAGLELKPSVLVALGAGGIVVTSWLLLLIQGQHSKLSSLAATDALTGLPNHRSFHEQLQAELERGRLHGLPIAVVLLDLDNFKQINDTHGHPYGDEVLRGVGRALRATIRETDRAARTGGDEFALILPGAKPDESVAVADRVRRAVAGVEVDGFELSCSAGIASFPVDADEAPTLLQLADSALYRAKHAGKSRTRRFDADHAPAAWTGHERDQVEEVLSRERPVIPMYQPVISLATGRVIGYEALARFPSAPDRSPEVWFAQAHGCGLGPELEAASIRAALEPFNRPLGFDLAVNVSPTAITSSLVLDSLAGDLTGIIVELTEHDFVADDEALEAALAELRARGARIALDDAGAGHSGLRQLMQARPDIVKLDRTITHGINGDPARIALVESFVRFARDVGAVVCAEGIESLDELATLADLDVDWGQGYVIGRPAEPWSEPSPVATELCRATLAETFRSLPSFGTTPGSSERRLVHLSARLSAARTPADLTETLDLIADELGASQVALSRWYPDRGVLETIAENGDVPGATTFPVAEYPITERVLREQEVAQVFVGDPESDPAEVGLLLTLGQRSLLIAPIIAGGESLGIIEAYSPTDRPWNRAEINRARVIANQFASVIPALVDDRG